MKHGHARIVDASCNVAQTPVTVLVFTLAIAKDSVVVLGGRAAEAGGFGRAVGAVGAGAGAAWDTGLRSQGGAQGTARAVRIGTYLEWGHNISLLMSL